jgi:Flp pilus assembly pilin Flp
MVERALILALVGVAIVAAMLHLRPAIVTPFQMAACYLRGDTTCVRDAN